MEVNEVLFWFDVIVAGMVAPAVLAWASSVSFAAVATGDGMTAASVWDRPGSFDLADHEPVRPASPSMLSQGLDQLVHMIGQDVLPVL